MSRIRFFLFVPILLAVIAGVRPAAAQCFNYADSTMRVTSLPAPGMSNILASNGFALGLADGAMTLYDLRDPGNPAVHLTISTDTQSIARVFYHRPAFYLLAPDGVYVHRLIQDDRFAGGWDIDYNVSLWEAVTSLCECRKTYAIVGARASGGIKYWANSTWIPSGRAALDMAVETTTTAEDQDYLFVGGQVADGTGRAALEIYDAFAVTDGALVKVFVPTGSADRSETYKRLTVVGTDVYAVRATTNAPSGSPATYATAIDRFDVSDPFNPVRTVTDIAFPAAGPEGPAFVTATDAVIFVAASSLRPGTQVITNTVSAYALTDPDLQAPIETEGLPSVPSAMDNDGAAALVSSADGGLAVVGWRAGPAPRSEINDCVYAAAVSDGLMVGFRDQGTSSQPSGTTILVYDVSDPAAPVGISGTPLPYVYDYYQVRLYRGGTTDCAYIMPGGHMISLADPTHPVFSNTMPMRPFSATISGNLMYTAAATRSSGYEPNVVRIFDLSNPLVPTTVSTTYVSADRNLRDVAVVGTTVYALADASAESPAQVYVIDAAVPAAPAVTDSIPCLARNRLVATPDGLLVALGDSVVQIIDPQQPASQEVLAEVQVGETTDVEPMVSQRAVYVATRYGGIKILDISDPVHPLVREGPAISDVAWLVDTGGDVLVTTTAAHYYPLGVWLPTRIFPGMCASAASGVALPPTAVGTNLATYPNPFNPMTSIEFDLARPVVAALAVYDVRGRRVVNLVDGEVGAGHHGYTWDGRDAAGCWAPSGTYFVRLEAGTLRETRKITLLR